MTRRATLLSLLSLFAALVVDAGAARAEDPPPPPKVKVERSASGQKIFKIETGIVVEGRVQKPNAFYVLQRSSIDYDWESLKQDFLPRIIDATSKNPF